MLQGLQSAGFFINEVIFVALGLIPLLLPELQSPYYDGLEPLLLSSNLVDGAPHVKFYINDIFSSKESPQEMYKFLQDYLLPRIKWFILKLSFKKLRLFCDEICALRLIYKIGGIMLTKLEQADRIRHFLVPTN
jgi:hypothetical protein